MTGQHEYDRIVVVGHSLGSVIAYDALNALWARRSRLLGLSYSRDEPTEPLEQLLRLVEDQVRLHPQVGGTEEQEQRRVDHAGYRDLQDGLLRVTSAESHDATSGERQPEGSRWIVSEVVSLGSPMTTPKTSQPGWWTGLWRAEYQSVLVSVHRAGEPAYATTTTTKPAAVHRPARVWRCRGAAVPWLLLPCSPCLDQTTRGDLAHTAAPATRLVRSDRRTHSADHANGAARERCDATQGPTVGPARAPAAKLPDLVEALVQDAGLRPQAVRIG